MHRVRPSSASVIEEVDTNPKPIRRSNTDPTIKTPKIDPIPT